MINYKLNGTESLGIEFGSTRIKAILVDANCRPLASGSYTWENELIDGYWTYSLQEIWNGLRNAYSSLNEEVFDKYGEYITNLASICFSAMMHGYMPFDKKGNMLCNFRTWRNTTTKEASDELTKLFNFNIPQRWSIAHLYQAILNKEQHVENIEYITTLAGYVHYKLTGKRVVGIGDASGMFPIDSNINDYDEKMLKAFSNLPEVKKYSWNIKDILPKVLLAGEDAGCLTSEGAVLIDPSGKLKPGIKLAPPEGDAGTGMVATNSVNQRTGNVSAGTSIFSMVVLENRLTNVHSEIDMVTTPQGKPVAMVHCNNCCSELDNWVKLFSEFAFEISADIPMPKLYDLIYNLAFNGEPDCGGMVSFNYIAGEPVAHLQDGRPLFVRRQDSNFTLKNFLRSQIYSTIATLKIGMDILSEENVKIDSLTGHGGLFKTPVVGQQFLADAVNSPVSVCETAGEGGAWGAAILARYITDNSNEPLGDYLNKVVFSKCKTVTLSPKAENTAGFNEYMKLFKKSLSVEETASKNI